MNSQEVKQKIIASGLHPSLQRIRILEHLYAHEGHFTADGNFRSAGRRDAHPFQGDRLQHAEHLCSSRAGQDA